MEIPNTETDATTMSSQSREQLTTVIDTLNQQFNQAPQQQQGEWSQEGEIHLTTKNEIIIRPITWLDLSLYHIFAYIWSPNWVFGPFERMEDTVFVKLKKWRLKAKISSCEDWRMKGMKIINKYED